jgi:septum site-determining protein MinC
MSADLVQGDMFTLMVVRMDDPNDPSFEGRLAEQIARNPSFFANAPVVLDLQTASGCATADAFHALRRLMKRQHLVLAGVMNANGTQIRAAMNADLAAFPAAGRRSAAPVPAPAPMPESRPVVPPSPTGDSGRTRIVTQPVRSGTQIYARGGDLVILNSVSPGAEVIADGHVHVYGALRGRAIAGAGGDGDARIFTAKLEAELLCIAGHYLLSEAMDRQYVGQSVQISLNGEELAIAKL